MAAAGVSVRDARPNEVDAVLDLWDLAYEATTRRSLQQDIPALLSHGPMARLLLAEIEDRIVGSLIVTFGGWRGNMYRLAVRPDHQRRGIARRLVADAHVWLGGLGCRRITALVEGNHDYATSFWESVGYVHDEDMWRYSKDFD